MEIITLECPKCGTQVEATGDMLEDGIVQCTNPDCRQAFQVDLPKGRVVGSRVENRPSEASQRDGEPGPERRERSRDAEETLIELHPAMLRRHPFQFTGGMLLLLVALAGAVYGLMQPVWWLVALAGAAALFAGGVLLMWWLRVISTTLTVTSERTILRKGLFSRRTSEVRHDDVRNLQVEQTFIERMLNVGDLAISSAGQDDLEIDIDGVTRPEEIAAIIRERQE